MYQRIKELADRAIAVQNKLLMEQALIEISAMCVDVPTGFMLSPAKDGVGWEAAQNPNIPPGLQDGGSWLPVIRTEARKEMEAAELAQHQAAKPKKGAKK